MAAKGSKDKIKKAAYGLFNKKGYSNTSVNEICSRAKVSKGGFYHHFESKEDLLNQILLDIMGKYFEETEENISTTDDPELKLKLLLELSFQYVTSTDLNYNFWLGLMNEEKPIKKNIMNIFNNLYREYRVMITEIIKSGQRLGKFRKDIDPFHVSVLLVGALEGIGLQYLVDSGKTLNIKKVRTSTKDIIFKMLKEEK